MKKVGIVVNKDKDNGLLYTSQVTEFLSQLGVCVHVYMVENFESIHEGIEFLVVLGGDGTMLRVCATAAISDTPVVGINLGKLGFLTDVDKEVGTAALVKILKGECAKEKRMLIEADFPSAEPINAGARIAVNEVNIYGAGTLTEFSLYVNEYPIDVFRADGLLVSTPTGSTAYNLSAGGPIIAPTAKMMVLTPVAPHNLRTRPIVICENDTVRVVVRGDARLIIDGVNRGFITSGHGVFVQKSKYCTTILRTTPSNIYKTLRKKKLL